VKTVSASLENSSSPPFLASCTGGADTNLSKSQHQVISKPNHETEEQNLNREFVANLHAKAREVALAAVGSKDPAATVAGLLELRDHHAMVYPAHPLERIPPRVDSVFRPHVYSYGAAATASASSSPSTLMSPSSSLSANILPPSALVEQVVSREDFDHYLADPNRSSNLHEVDEAEAEEFQERLAAAKQYDALKSNPELAAQLSAPPIPLILNRPMKPGVIDAPPLFKVNATSAIPEKSSSDVIPSSNESMTGLEKAQAYMQRHGYGTRLFFISAFNMIFAFIILFLASQLESW
jgi:hypothetical protein